MSIQIRAWEDKDIPVIASWITDKDTRKALAISQEASDTQVETGLWLAFSDRTQGWFMAVDGEERIGMFGLTSINPDGSAIFHIVMSPEHRGKGGFVGRSARMFLAENGLRKLIALISRDNHKSRRLAEGFGFEFEDIDLGFLYLAESKGSIASTGGI